MLRQQTKMCKDVQKRARMCEVCLPKSYKFNSILSLRKRRRPEDLHFPKWPSWCCRQLPAQVTRLNSFWAPWQIELNSDRLLNSSFCCSTSCNGSASSCNGNAMAEMNILILVNGPALHAELPCLTTALSASAQRQRAVKVYEEESSA